MKSLLKNNRIKHIAMKKGLVFILILSLTMLLSACGIGKNNNTNNENAEAYYTFTDDEGKQIVLKDKPQKVAVLFSSYADVWCLAGGSVDITVGETVERGFAKEGVTLVDAGAGKSIDVERLVAEKPDFVICSADIEAQVEVAELMNNSGIPAACFRVDNLNDYIEMLKICTDITGDREAFKKNGTDVMGEVEAILASVPKEKGKTILFIRAGSSASSTKAKTAADNFVCGMLKEMGTINIAEAAPVLLDGLSIEEILMKNPDYIFVSTMGNEEAAIANMTAVFQQPEWQQLTAVKEGNYIFLPKSMFQYKPNAKWAEAYRYLAEVLYEEY